MKLFTMILTGLLVVSLTACGANKSNTPPTTTPSAPESQNESVLEKTTDDTSLSPAEAEETTYREENEYVSMTVQLDKKEHDLHAPVKTRVTITNISDRTLAYVHGSGSNLSPDALDYTIGDFSRMFTPAMMTMDYRTEMLEPGKSLEFDLDFAPYVAKDQDTPIGDDKDISFFQSEDFTPVEPGTYEGKVIFSGRVVPEDAVEDTMLEGFESMEEVRAEIEFEVVIR